MSPIRFCRFENNRCFYGEFGPGKKWLIVHTIVNICYLFMFGSFRRFSDDFTVFLHFSFVSRVLGVGDFSVFRALVHHPRPGAVHVHQLVVGLFESFAQVSFTLYRFLVGLQANKTHITIWVKANFCLSRFYIVNNFRKLPLQMV